MRKVWLVKHPISQYNEDVKSLARKNDLIIYDVKFKDAIDPAQVADETPALTVKGEKPKAAKKAKKVDEQKED